MGDSETSKRLIKGGRLITADYVLPKPAPGGAGEHNRCYQTPRLLFLFFSIPRGLQLLKQACCIRAALAFGSCLASLSRNLCTLQVALFVADGTDDDRARCSYVHSCGLSTVRYL